MGDVWIKEAEDLKAVGTSGVMEGGAPKVTWHVTVSPSGRSKSGIQYFDVMHRVLTSKRSEPHILYDPVTDRLGQYFPLNRSARALGNDGPRRTNGAGVVNIQIEVVADTAPVFTKYWKPGPNFRALMRAIRSWDIPDVWPSGRLATSYGDRVNRSWTSYRKAGHFAHCNVPGNDHWDTGPIDQKAIFVAANEEDDLPSTIEVWTDPLTKTGRIIPATQNESALAILTRMARNIELIASLEKAQASAAQVAAAVVAALPVGQSASAHDIAAEIIAQLTPKEA
jgi:hypothetical protein